jgi:CubicO group peptidase (beta-lactamase class C family)
MRLSCMSLLNSAQLLMQDAVSNGVFPGGVLLVSQNGDVLIHQAFGQADLTTGTPVSTRTIFDLASLTKPFATTLAVMKLMERSQLALDHTLGDFMVPCRGTDKAGISVRHLLYHNSGLPDYRPYFMELVEEKPSRRRELILSRILDDPPAYPIGEKVVYSDLGFMLLRGIVETVSGSRLDEFVRKEIYLPLQLKDLFFVDPEHPLPEDRFAATEKCPWRHARIRGVVHDENAYIVGGVDGHAGLFGTAADVYCLLMEVLGTYSGGSSHHIFEPDLLREFLDYGKGTERALGFDRPAVNGSASGCRFSQNSVGHLGFTGTSFWMDLDRSIIVILLTNRVHPSRANEKIRDFRPVLHDVIMKSLR